MHIVRPSPAVIAARKREIAQRYDRKRRKGIAGIPVTFAAFRVAELTRLYAHRYGDGPLPDTDDCIILIRVMCDHIGRLRDANRRISQWLDRNTPWLSIASRERVIRDATERPLRYRADRLAWKLRVTAAERHLLGLRTIGAIDQTREERAALSKQLRRDRERERRRQQGAKPRAEYEATATKPWRAAGISRATWYRRHKHP